MEHTHTHTHIHTPEVHPMLVEKVACASISLHHSVHTVKHASECNVTRRSGSCILTSEASIVQFVMSRRLLHRWKQSWPGTLTQQQQNAVVPTM